jgi:hypothetical protein
VTVGLTEFTARRLHDLPSIARDGIALSRGWWAMPGAIGVVLYSDVFTKTGALAAEHEPGEALERWLQRYTSLLATKRGLAAALHSETPAFEALPACFQEPLLPALASLLGAAAAAGQVRADVEPSDLLQAVASLCLPAADDADHTQRMVALLIDGLRYGATAPTTNSSTG